MHVYTRITPHLAHCTHTRFLLLTANGAGQGGTRKDDEDWTSRSAAHHAQRALERCIEMYISGACVKVHDSRNDDTMFGHTMYPCVCGHMWPSSHKPGMQGDTSIHTLSAVVAAQQTSVHFQPAADLKFALRSFLY